MSVVVDMVMCSMNVLLSIVLSCVGGCWMMVGMRIFVLYI